MVYWSVFPGTVPHKLCPVSIGLVPRPKQAMQGDNVPQLWLDGPKAWTALPGHTGVRSLQNVCFEGRFLRTFRRGSLDKEFITRLYKKHRLLTLCVTRTFRKSRCSHVIVSRQPLLSDTVSHHFIERQTCRSPTGLSNGLWRNPLTRSYAGSHSRRFSGLSRSTVYSALTDTDNGMWNRTLLAITI